MLTPEHLKRTSELLAENRIYFFNRTKYEDLERAFYISSFRKEPSDDNDEIKGTLKLTYIFNEDKYNTKKIIKLFEQFLTMFNTIIFEKGREFIIENTDGGSYSLVRSEDDELKINEYLIKYINELLSNFDNTSDNRIIITLFISGVDNEFEIKSDIAICKTIYPNHKDD